MRVGSRLHPVSTSSSMHPMSVQPILDHSVSFRECSEVQDTEVPLRQGDVLEWIDTGSDPWSQHAIIVTANCDIAHQKHRGVLACVPVLDHLFYLASFPLADRLERERVKLFERAVQSVRDYQTKNRPDFPTPMSDGAIGSWIDSADPTSHRIRFADPRCSARTQVCWSPGLRACMSDQPRVGRISNYSWTPWPERKLLPRARMTPRCAESL